MSRTQQIITKFNSISRQSGEVTAALSGMDAPPAIEAYNRIQAVEETAVAAAIAEKAMADRMSSATREFDAAQKNLRLMNAACVNICAVQLIVSAAHFTVVDKGDDAGLARRLEPEIRRVPGYGPGLADAVAHLVRDLQAADAASQTAKAALTTAERELDSAILNLQGVVAQGRAVLATFGVKLSRKKAKKKPAAPANQPTEVPTPVPAAA